MVIPKSLNFNPIIAQLFLDGLIKSVKSWFTILIFRRVYVPFSYLKQVIDEPGVGRGLNTKDNVLCS